MSSRNDLTLKNSLNCRDLREIKAQCTFPQLDYVVPGAGFELVTSGLAPFALQIMSLTPKPECAQNAVNPRRKSKILSPLLESLKKKHSLE